MTPAAQAPKTRLTVWLTTWIGALFLVLGLSLDMAKADSAPSVEPRVLSDKDIDLYNRIFDVQKGGNWEEADRLIGQLDNDVLMSEVLYQRYMHPTKYRSKYHELRDWLSRYNDHPDARNIHRLALRRKPAREAPPVDPLPRRWTAPETERAPAPVLSDEEKYLRAVERANRAAITKHMGRRGNIERAEKRLWASENAGVFDDVTFDTHLSQIAGRHYYRGNYDKALALATMAADRSGDEVPSSSWIAGLISWRNGDWTQAADFFKRVGPAAEEEHPELASAGYFWAARSYLRNREPDKVAAQLEKAARHPRTFYGILAARQLGMTPEYDWSLPPLTEAHMAEATRIPGISRAIAWSQLGNAVNAEQEFNLAVRRQQPAYSEALIHLATHLNLIEAQITQARRSDRDGKPTPDKALFPMTPHAPENGFKLDPALLYAFARQESNFVPHAKSWAGARGLMQLMPATASYIQRDPSLRRGNVSRLFEPDFNMMLGQKYILYLMDKDTTRDNLILIAAAYNAGPGNVARWLRRSDHGDDWLLFMESIPIFETRHYVERVLENLWIYRARAGEPSGSLDDLARGITPRYAPASPQTAGLSTGQ